MLKYIRAVLSCFLVAVLCVSGMVVPASAATQYTSVDNIWNWIAQSGWSPLGTLVGRLAGAVCPNTEDGYHRSSDYQYDGANGYYRCICDHCGESFTAYATDVGNSYNDYVDSLQFTRFDSDGYLYMPFYSYSLVCVYASVYETNSGFPTTASWRPTSSSSYCGISWRGSFTAPCSGTYRLMYFYAASNIKDYNSSGSLYWSSFGLNAGDSKTISYDSSIYVANSSSDCSFVLYPYIRCKPLTPIVDIAPELVDPTTHVGSIVGDYGIIGDNGTINKVDTQYIVNETTNVYTNPATGESSSILDWAYDYGDRSYSLTLDGEVSAKVVFGDENVTIVEGDTTYNVYYITEVVTPSTCSHDWTEVDGSRREPTCTVAGSQSYYCLICGDEKTETLSATGHTWTVKQSVVTQYDESGNLLVEGYTLYECSVCGTQYKDSDGTGPPSSSSGSGDDSSDSGNWFTDFFGKLGELLGSFFGGLITAIGNIILGILDGLLTLVSSAIERLGNLIDLFGSFGEALRSLWSWLPPEVVSVMVAGVTVVIFVAVLKIFL